MTPFTVKKAASRRRRPVDRVLVDEEHGDDGDLEPVPDVGAEPEAGRRQQRDGAGMHRCRAHEHAADAEPRRPRVQPGLEVVLSVEERVEEIEARHPQADGATERPRLPRQLAGHRDPAADGSETQRRAEPQVQPSTTRFRYG